jgi:hypothetical protein
MDSTIVRSMNGRICDHMVVYFGEEPVMTKCFNDQKPFTHWAKCEHSITVFVYLIYIVILFCLFCFLLLFVCLFVIFCFFLVDASLIALLCIVALVYIVTILIYFVDYQGHLSVNGNSPVEFILCSF